MQRSRRNQKPFVAGGVYNPNQSQQNAYSNNYNSVMDTDAQQQPQTPIQGQAPQVKESPQEMPDAETFDNDENGLTTEHLSDSGSVDENGKLRFKKIFGIRKKSSIRIREKKMRQNRQLRKSLLPKNALMALNEIKGIKISECQIDANSGGGFTAVMTINETQYQGKGNSKAAAKNDACEKALRDHVIARMVNKPRLLKANSTPGNGTAEPMEVTADNESEPAATAEESDDVPMLNLASFAIYKLFCEWENEGFVIPEMHPAAGAPTVISSNVSENGSVKEPKIRNELPPNWETMHPATLLCQMRPGCVYSDLGSTGEKMNVIQTIGITIDGKSFSGTGRSKKIARRNAAVAACNDLFGTTFVKEEP